MGEVQFRQDIYSELQRHVSHNIRTTTQYTHAAHVKMWVALSNKIGVALEDSSGQNGLDVKVRLTGAPTGVLGDASIRSELGSSGYDPSMSMPAQADFEIGQKAEVINGNMNAEIYRAKYFKGVDSADYSSIQYIEDENLADGNTRRIKVDVSLGPFRTTDGVSSTTNGDPCHPDPARGGNMDTASEDFFLYPHEESARILSTGIPSLPDVVEVDSAAKVTYSKECLAFWDVFDDKVSELLLEAARTRSHHHDSLLVSYPSVADDVDPMTGEMFDPTVGGGPSTMRVALENRLSCDFGNTFLSEITWGPPGGSLKLYQNYGSLYIDSSPPNPPDIELAEVDATNN